VNDPKSPMKVISREELKAKLDRGDNFNLVNALGQWAFNAKHTPGSINISKIEDARTFLDPNHDIVIYCSNPSCIASIIGYQHLTNMGFSKVRRYAGGIVDWEQAGLTLFQKLLPLRKLYQPFLTLIATRLSTRY
jgi:rhodanese-related sulfurtransferase